MTVRSAWLSPDGQGREDTRTNQVGALTAVDESRGRSGVLPGSATGQYRTGGLSLTGAAGTLGASVGAGRAVVQAGADRGAYPVAVTAPVPLTFADGDAQYGRVDLVVLRVYDDTYDGSGRTEAAVEIVRGTPAAVPAAPAAPDVALALFSVAVPANAGTGRGGLAWDTAVVDLRPTTVALGGILPTRPDDTAPGGYPGQYRDINNTLERWDGAAWTGYPKGVGGIAPAGAVGTGAYAGQYRDTANGVLQRWNGAVWLPAAAPSSFTGTNDAGRTSSTTYTSTLVDTAVSTLALSFVAPPNGAILLSFGARMVTTGSSTASAFLAPQIVQGSTVALAAVDDNAVTYGGAVTASVATTTRVYGLAPGKTHTLTALYRTSDAAVSCWFDNVFLRVDPAN
ncbi:hypothetical protein [Streptomyces sp. NPDC088785]|uniref:hypothetical protein n=1 Tax=Streptomyces sp. NPDC088785 TaxID=3365897 RepID=UPI0037F613C7